MSYTIRFLELRYTLDDDGNGGTTQVYSEYEDNGISPAPYDDRAETFVTLAEAAMAIRDHGCDEDCGSWFLNTDYPTTNWATGEEAELTAHPSDDIAPEDYATLSDLVALDYHELSKRVRDAEDARADD